VSAPRLPAVPIEFRGSPARTLGVELELGLVDLATRELRSDAVEILAELSAGDATGAPGDLERIKHELYRCTVEVVTGVCDSVGEARRDLEASLRQLRAVTRPRGLDLIGSATHPFSDWRDLELSPGERYAHLVETIQWPARRLATHGVHFHVGVPSGEAAIAVVQSLAFHLPLFLAASASSPYWLGVDTGMASSRTKIFEGLPTAGLPPRLGSWQEFEELMSGLLHAGVITSIREIWWDCRPHPDYGTVELRMCDGLTNLDDAMALAALAQCLVAELVEQFEAGDPLPGAAEWVVRENKWLASRHGLDESLIVDHTGRRLPTGELLYALVDRLRPRADRLGCRAELDAVDRIVEGGPSYRRQRRIVAEGGTLADVVDALVAEHAAGRP
jgi:glutamate---cysteine ligase / carboxylate-amine ligase